MHLTTRTGSHLALRLGWKKQKHGVPNFMEGSLISYEIGDPGVTKILGNWGPGPPISYENGDPGPQFHMKMGTWGPHFGGFPFSLDTGRRSGTQKPVNVFFYSGSHSKQRLSRMCGHRTHNLLVLRSPQFSFTVGPQSLYGHKSVGDMHVSRLQVKGQQHHLSQSIGPAIASVTDNLIVRKYYRGIHIS